METAIAALIIITLTLFGVLTLAHGYLSVQYQNLQAWRAMEERIGERARTNLLPLSAVALDGGSVVEVTVKNVGSARLTDFAQWDLIVEYEAVAAHIVQWYPYVATAEPGPNQWTVKGIYLDATQAIPEACEPGILNPGEELVAEVRISPPIADGTTGFANISTPNGIQASAVVVASQ